MLPIFGDVFSLISDRIIIRFQSLTCNDIRKKNLRGHHTAAGICSSQPPPSSASAVLDAPVFFNKVIMVKRIIHIT